MLVPIAAVRRVLRTRPGPTAIRRLALATLIANVGIVVTGGAVRLTSSGLGCPTWPRCTDGSYTPTAAVAGHGLIEFTNRTLSFVIGLVTLATLLACWRAAVRRPMLTRLALVTFLGIPAQAVLGGITVLTGLNPWTVMAHFLVSAALVGVAAVLWQRSGQTDDPALPAARREVELLVRVTAGFAAATLVIGTVVTGSGPHAGDAAAARNGLSPELVSQLHADVVMLLIGLSVGAWIALAAVRASAAARRAAVVLVAVEMSQAFIGFLQYFTHLPVLLVALHMLGACLVWIAAVRLVLAVRPRPSLQPPAAVDLAASVSPAPSSPSSPAVRDAADHAAVTPVL